MKATRKPRSCSNASGGLDLALKSAADKAKTATLECVVVSLTKSVDNLNWLANELNKKRPDDPLKRPEVARLIEQIHKAADQCLFGGHIGFGIQQSIGPETPDTKTFAEVVHRLLDDGFDSSQLVKRVGKVDQWHSWLKVRDKT